MEGNNTENIVEQDGIQDGNTNPNRDSNGQFVAGNNANPNGKGGFGDYPERINKNGRPNKGWSWKEVLEDIAEQIAPLEVEGKKVSFKEAVGQRLWLEAINGNVMAMKELFTRMEGLPRITMDVEGKVDMKIPELVVTLKKIIEEDDDDTEEETKSS